MSEVVCLGIFVADALGRPIDTIPEKARLQLFDRMELHTGGCAVNTGIAMAKLGMNVGVIGKVGDDGFGDFLIKVLSSHGVDTKGVNLVLPRPDQIIPLDRATMRANRAAWTERFQKEIAS